MADLDPSQMKQDTFNLLKILHTHRERTAEALMGGLMKFDRTLSKAIDTVNDELRGARRAEIIAEATQTPLQSALQYGADDLVSISRTAFEHFETIPDNNALTPEATADTLVWLQVAGQTRIGLRLIFQLSLLNGRAPNGKILPSDG